MEWVRKLRAIDAEVQLLLRELAEMHTELAQANRAATATAAPPEHLRAYT